MLVKRNSCLREWEKRKRQAFIVDLMCAWNCRKRFTHYLFSSLNTPIWYLLWITQWVSGLLDILKKIPILKSDTSVTTTDSLFLLMESKQGYVKLLFSYFHSGFLQATLRKRISWAAHLQQWKSLAEPLLKVIIWISNHDSLLFISSNCTV